MLFAFFVTRQYSKFFCVGGCLFVCKYFLCVSCVCGVFVCVCVCVYSCFCVNHAIVFSCYFFQRSFADIIDLEVLDGHSCLAHNKAKLKQDLSQQSFIHRNATNVADLLCE